MIGSYSLADGLHPCCSFDIVRDDLGGPRSTFPHCITLVAGTQAAGPRQNALAMMKLSNLGQGKHGEKVCKPTLIIA